MVAGLAGVLTISLLISTGCVDCRISPPPASDFRLLLHVSNLGISLAITAAVFCLTFGLCPRSGSFGAIPSSAHSSPPLFSIWSAFRPPYSSPTLMSAPRMARRARRATTPLARQPARVFEDRTRTCTHIRDDSQRTPRGRLALRQVASETPRRPSRPLHGLRAGSWTKWSGLRFVGRRMY